VIIARQFYFVVIDTEIFCKKFSNEMFHAGISLVTTMARERGTDSPNYLGHLLGSV